MKTKTFTLGRFPRLWLLIFGLFAFVFSEAQTSPECPLLVSKTYHENGNGSNCYQARVKFQVSNFTPPVRYKLYADGAEDYTYWQNNGTNGEIDILAGCLRGTYTLKVDDGSDCPPYCITVQLTGPPCLAVNINECDISMSGGCNGTWTVPARATGGQGPYNYCWTSSNDPDDCVSTGSSMTTSTPGVYRVTVTDANGCITSKLIELKHIEIDKVTVKHVSCIGKGSVRIQTKGGLEMCLCSSRSFSVSLSRVGGTLPLPTPTVSPNLDPLMSIIANDRSWMAVLSGDDFTFSGLDPGTYKLSVCERGGCCKTVEFTVANHNNLAAQTRVQQTNCNDSCGNTITVTPSGGDTPYTYTWMRNGVPMPGASGNSQSGLCPGTYTIKVKDVNGCIITKTVIVQPSLLTPGSVKINQYCYRDFKSKQYRVHFDVVITGGVAPYTVEWIGVLPPGQNTGFSATPNTNVSLRITDANGCVRMVNFRSLDCYIYEPQPGQPPYTNIDLVLQPNPNLGVFTTGVTFADPSPIDISIYDQLGNKIFYSDQGFLMPGSYTFPVDISTAPPGTYHLLINEGQATATFIKQ